MIDNTSDKLHGIFFHHCLLLRSLLIPCCNTVATCKFACCSWLFTCWLYISSRVCFAETGHTSILARGTLWVDAMYEHYRVVYRVSFKVAIFPSVDELHVWHNVVACLNWKYIVQLIFLSISTYIARCIWQCSRSDLHLADTDVKKSFRHVNNQKWYSK